MSTKEQDLLDRITALEVEINKLKYPQPPAPQRPSVPYADSIRFGMPQSAVDACVAAVVTS